MLSPFTWAGGGARLTIGVALNLRPCGVLSDGKNQKHANYYYILRGGVEGILIAIRTYDRP